MFQIKIVSCAIHHETRNTHLATLNYSAGPSSCVFFTSLNLVAIICFKQGLESKNGHYGVIFADVRCAPPHCMKIQGSTAPMRTSKILEHLKLWLPPTGTCHRSILFSEVCKLNCPVIYSPAFIYFLFFFIYPIHYLCTVNYG